MTKFSTEVLVVAPMLKILASPMLGGGRGLMRYMQRQDEWLLTGMQSCCRALPPLSGWDAAKVKLEMDAGPVKAGGAPNRG